MAPTVWRSAPANPCARTDIAMPAFHGDHDDFVTPEGSFAMARAIRACGVQPRLTIYSDPADTGMPYMKTRRCTSDCSPSGA